MNAKTLRTPTLDIRYLEAGSPKGTPVLLLHGFPDDATAYAPVMEQLAARGYHAFAPYLRGFGPTRFRDDKTPRAGDFAALGQDALDFLDGLDLNDVIVVGQDWGSPSAEVAAALRPERVAKLVKLNWYGIYTMAEMARAQSFAYPQLRTLWYVWMLNTQLGEMVLEHDRTGFAGSLWEQWSPSWEAAQRAGALERVLPSFTNPDFARVVLSAYRANVMPNERDPRNHELRARLNDPPPISCETIVLRGADDGVEKTPLSADGRTKYFRGGLREQVLPGVGHFPHREAPDAVLQAITDPLHSRAGA